MPTGSAPPPGATPSASGAQATPPPRGPAPAAPSVTLPPLVVSPPPPLAPPLAAKGPTPGRQPSPLEASHQSIASIASAIVSEVGRASAVSPTGELDSGAAGRAPAAPAPTPPPPPPPPPLAPTAPSGAVPASAPPGALPEDLMRSARWAATVEADLDRPPGERRQPPRPDVVVMPPLQQPNATGQVPAVARRSRLPLLLVLLGGAAGVGIWYFSQATSPLGAGGGTAGPVSGADPAPGRPRRRFGCSSPSPRRSTGGSTPRAS